MHSQAVCDAAHSAGAHASRLGFSWEENPYTQASDVLLRIEWNLGWWGHMRPDVAMERDRTNSVKERATDMHLPELQGAVAAPLDFLRTIVHADFPLRFEVQQSIQCVHVLLASELVEAQVVYGDRPGSYAAAIVNSITPAGLAALSPDSAYQLFA